MRRPDAVTVLNLAPHPDDEAIGAPATLLALRAEGHRVMNVACSLGRAAHHDRREAELREACRRGGFELVVPPLARRRLAEVEEELAELVAAAIVNESVDLVVSPSPHDGHHGHETVGRAARDAVWAVRDRRVSWWMWGLWADLPHPTVFFPFDEARLSEALHVLGAHAGEVARNDYASLVRARAVANSVLGSERVFGFGQPQQPSRYAELLCEVVPEGGQWLAGEPRTLDPRAPFADGPGTTPLGWWLYEASFSARLAAARRDAAPTPAGG